MVRTTLGVTLALAMLAACERPLSNHPEQAEPVRRQEQGALASQAVMTSPLAKAQTPQPGAGPVKAGLRVRTVRQFGWGSGPAQLGHVLGGEQNPEAPMALDVDNQGTVVILDQVNERLVIARRDGSLGQVPAPRTAQDLVATGNQAWLLDRLVAKELRRVDLGSGAVLQSLPLAGVEEPGAISALWAHQVDLYAEIGHATLQRLANAQGQLQPEQTLAGRPSVDGTMVFTAARQPPDGVSVVVRRQIDAAGAPPVRALQTSFPLPIEQIVEISADSAGRIWLVVDLGDAQQQRRQVLMWPTDSDDPLRADLAAWHGPEETFRPARLSATGHLFALGLAAEGMTLQEVAP